MEAAQPNPKKRGSHWAWVWLAYTGFIFIQPIMEPSLNVWLGTLAALAVFVGIISFYFRAMEQGQPTRLWFALATLALGLISYPWNQGASTFFIYAAAFLPFLIESVRRVVLLILLECLVVLAEGAVFSIVIRSGPFHIGWPNTFIAIFLIVVVGGGNIFRKDAPNASFAPRLKKTWPWSPLPSANALHATCTMCWDTRFP